MPTCPNCGHSFNLGSPKTELEIFIKENQPNFKPFSIKREICHRFGVRKFADLPQEKYPEALAFAQQEVSRLTTLWSSHRTLGKAVNAILREVPHADRYLETTLSRHLEDLFGETHWATMTVEEAVAEIKQAIGDQNIWEFAYKSTEKGA